MINTGSDEMFSATSFIRNMGMLSYPVEQSLRKLLMIFKTSSEFVVCSSICSVALFSGSHIIVQ